MDPDNGPHRAIVAARLAGRPLVLAGPVQRGQEEYFRDRVEPFIDAQRVVHAGEVAGVAKRRLYADATALLMPIRLPEPFGMVMVGALACGTPVIAFPEGAATEIVIDGENGMLVDDEAEMAEAWRPTVRLRSHETRRLRHSKRTSAVDRAGGPLGARMCRYDLNMTYSIFETGNLVASFDREDEDDEALERIAQENARDR
jgi:glycogen synthase